jgi:hypothetical protein
MAKYFFNNKVGENAGAVFFDGAGRFTTERPHHPPT